MLTGDTELFEALADKATALYLALFERMNQLDTELEAKAQANASGAELPGGVRLPVRSGQLLASIHALPVEAEGDLISGMVEAGGDAAPYAGFQERGTRGPYEIKPVTKVALAFLIEGKQAFAKRVMHPGLAERAFLGTALEEMRSEIVSGLQATVEAVRVQ